MKKLLLLLLIITSTYVFAISRDLLVEAFDDGVVPAGWVIDGSAPEGWIYSNGFIEDHTSGTGGIMQFACTSVNADDYAGFISPQLSVTAVNNSFNLWLNYFAVIPGFGNDASLFVDISTNEGVSWIEGSTNFIEGTQDTGWFEVNVDLSSYEDQVIQIRLRAISDYGGYNIGVDDVTGPEIFVSSGVPGVADNPEPQSGEFDLDVLQTLEWNATSGQPTGFKLYFGTSDNPELVETLGNVYNYEIPYALEFETEYFWKVVPFNADGDAEDCPTWNFTTGENVTISSLPHFEGFTEGTTNNWPINNWRRAEGELVDDHSVLVWDSFGWASDIWLNDEELSEPCARVNIYGTGRIHWLITPPFELNGNPGDALRFDMALTQYANGEPAQLADDDRFAVVISTDNGYTWNNANVLQEWTSETPISNETTPISIDLSSYSGLVRIGFYGESLVENEDVDLFIDNVIIGTETANLYQPEFVSATLVDNNVNLTWDITEAYNQEFIIYRNEVEIARVNGGIFEYADENLESGTYQYFVSALYGNIEINSELSNEIEITVANEVNPTITEIELQNYPNPFNISNSRDAVTRISFQVPDEYLGKKASVSIYNVLGQKINTVFDEEIVRNTTDLTWNAKDSRGTNVSSGVYFYRLNVENKIIKVNKCILMK